MVSAARADAGSTFKGCRASWPFGAAASKRRILCFFNSLPYVDRRMPRAAAGVGTRFHRAAAQGDARSSTTPLNSG